MRQKLIGIKRAVNIVKHGDTIVFNGSMDWTPMALIRELVRQKLRQITAIGVVSGAMNLDFLLGAGVATEVETCSLGFDKFARVAPNYSRLLKEGRIRMLDNT